MKKLDVKIVVPKQQEEILYSTRRDDQHGTLYCTKCPNFSTTTQTDLNYHIAKRNRGVRVKTVTNVKFVWRKSLAFVRYDNIGALNMEIR